MHDQVLSIIAREAHRAPEELRAEMTLDDLGLDSLGLVEVIFAIEEQFDISVPFNANDGAGVAVRHFLGRGDRARGRKADRRGVAFVGGRVMHRVVITGAGTINALAEGVAGTQAAMAAGRSGIGALQFRDVERLNVRIGAQIHGFSPEDRFDLGKLALYDAFTQYALIAGEEAMAQAGLEAAPDPARWGCIIGSAGGGAWHCQ